MVQSLTHFTFSMFTLGSRDHKASTMSEVVDDVDLYLREMACDKCGRGSRLRRIDFNYCVYFYGHALARRLVLVGFELSEEFIEGAPGEDQEPFDPPQDGGEDGGSSREARP